MPLKTNSFVQRVRRIRWGRWLGWTFLTAVALVIAFQATVRTDWFQNKVRDRVIAELERATGGQVELGTFLFEPSRMTVVITRLVLRGSEPPQQPPLLSVPRLRVDLNLLSLLSPSVSVRAIQVESPEVYLLVLDDGTTNIPGASASARSRSTDSELIDLAVGRLEIRQASVHWNDTRSVFAIEAEDVEALARFEPVEQRYAASLRVGSSRAEYAGLRPFVSEARADLHFYQDHLEARQVRITVDGASLNGEARLDDWEHPQLTSSYELRAQLQPWLERAGFTRFTAGVAEAVGELAWNPDDGPTYSGRLEMSATLTGTANQETPRLAARAAYSGDRDQLRTREIEASVLGGQFRGEAEFARLLASGGPRWRAAGDFDGYTIRSLLDALHEANLLRTRRRQVPWRSSVHGWLEAKGSWSTSPDISASLIFAGPSAVPAGSYPLDGVVDVVFDGESRGLQLARVDLSTTATRLSSHGEIAADGRSRLDLLLELQRTTDLAAAANLAGASLQELPLELHGKAAMEGTLTGQFFLDREPEAEFIGRIEAQNFTAAGYLWSDFSSAVTLSPQLLRLDGARLSNAAGSARADLEAALARYRPTEQGSVRGNIGLEEMSLEPLLAMAGRGGPVSGRVTGQALLSGTIGNPRLSASAEVVSPRVWDEPFDRVALTAGYDSGSLELSRIEVVKGSAHVTGNGYFQTADRSFRFDLKGEGWRLQELDRFKEPTPATGELDLELRAAGRLASEQGELFDELDIAGNWDLQNVSLGAQPLGSLSGTIATEGEVVRLGWQSQMLEGQVQGEAELQPAGDQSFRGRMTFQQVAALSVAQLADLPVQELEGEVDGSFEFSGDLSEPSRLTAEGTITRLEVGLASIPGAQEGYSLWNPFPLRWSLSEARLQLDGMRLLGQGTDIAINGSLPFSPAGPADRRLNLAVEGDFNLSVIESFRSGVQASGISSVQVNVRGTIDDPQLRGRVQLRNAGLRSEEFANGLTDLSGTLSFTGRRVRIEELRATTGGGDVRLTGTATYEEGSASYRIGATANQVRLRYPANISSTVDGDLTFSGNNLQTLLTGEILVTRLSTSSDLDLGGMIASLGEPQQTPPGGPLLSNTQLNVSISSVPDLPVQTSMFRNVQLEIDMRLVGTAVSPSLTGNVSITQGDLRFQGTRYVINRGEIEFANPFRIEPVLDFELETRIRDVDIALNISGPVRNMNVSYRSDPPLEFNQLVSLIAVGRSPTTDPVLAAQERVQAQPLLQAGANTVLSQALSRPFSKGLQRFFGVSRLRVDPQVGGAEAVPTARISTEQQITTNLTLIYSYNLADSEQQSVRVEWAPSRRLSFIVTRDENGLVGADVLYKKRLR